MFCRGVRGATTADSNSREDILKATRELLALLIRENDIHADDVASAVFSTTHDLDAEFPALAARQLGWRPKTDLRTGFTRIFDWIRENEAELRIRYVSSK